MLYKFLIFVAARPPLRKTVVFSEHGSLQRPNQETNFVAGDHPTSTARHFRPSHSARQAQKRRRLRTCTQASHGRLASVGQFESRRTRFAVDVGVAGMSFQALRSRLVPSYLNSLRVYLSFANIFW